MNNARHSLCLYLLTVALNVAPASAAILRVKPDAPGTAHDGMSWATAFTAIQPALDAAQPGDEVWVARGTYMETVTLTAEVALLGGFAGTETARTARDWKTNETVLDGNQQGNTVTVPPGASQATVLDGFTVQHGNGIVTPISYPARWGGGLNIENASPTISHNVFRDNNVVSGYATSLGGGAFIYGGSPSITGNQFIGNGISGLDAYGATLELRDNVATGNGRGFAFGNCTLAVVNNTVSLNNGAGIYQSGSSTGLIANNLILSNGDYGIDAGNGPVLSHNDAYGNRDYDYRYGGVPNGNLRVDPRTEADNLHLRPDSPCVDAGDDSLVQAGETDIDGQPRHQGQHVDIGADEFDYSYTIPPPPPIVHVRPDGDDANDGSTWERAKKTLTAAAFDLALEGGEIWAAAGSYSGRIEIGNGVSLYGGFRGSETARESRDPLANETVIAEGTVVVLPGAAETAVDGFTFSKGSRGISSQAASLTVSRNRFEVGGIDQAGGSVSVIDNTFGGESQWTFAVLARNANVTIARNTISQRYVGGNAFGSTTAVDFSGGAVTLWNCTGTVTGNVIRGNGNYSGNATVTYGGGAGIYALRSTLFITGNVISGNSVMMQGYDFGYAEGGGILGSGGTLIIADNLVTNNSLSGAGDNGGGGAGAGIYLREGSALLVNNTVCGNTIWGASTWGDVTKQGGGIYTVTLDRDLGGYTGENNIVAFNDTGVDWYGDAPQWSYNDVFGNGHDYSKVGPDLTGANGNIRVDPLFVNRDKGDYHLSPLSLCLDAGDNLAVIDTHDLDGRFRIQGRHVDLGAYEFPVTSRKTMADVARALRILAGFTATTRDEVYRLNVTGYAQQIDLQDAARLARMVTGLEPNP